ncbi:beta-1,4-galactosyltransferase galt-1-like [Leptodactylus fuscus]|uniref:beta-1,4-galactosyltransferase galt-1-like n=1 Tax=Leptodactylus fuscus TaxID=238119 RepID=UPI003F4EB157
MSFSLKRTFFSCNLFVLIFIFLFYLLQPQDSSINSVPDIATGPFTVLEDNKTLIISLYHDPRESNVIRLLAIVHKTVKNIYCLFHCKQNEYLRVKAKIDIVRDNFGFPYETANLLCEIPSECDYVSMSVQENSSKDVRKVPVFKITKNPIGTFPANFTVCISAFYGQYNNVLQVIQTIEMYKLLGASKVTIYNNSCHDNVDKVLRHYIQEGVVDVIPWPIDKFLRTSRKWKYVQGLDSDIGYYGQIASLNDCVYRNMYKTKFLLLNDIDEIILPVKHWDWTSLMESLQKRYPNTSVFRFENHAFPSSVNATGSNLWDHIPGINILQYPYREPSDSMSIKPRKMIINPRKVMQTLIHAIRKAEGDSTDVSSQDAILFHCKNKRNMTIPEKDLIKDDILLRYNMSLVPNVDKVVKKLFHHH